MKINANENVNVNGKKEDINEQEEAYVSVKKKGTRKREKQRNIKS